MKEIYNQIKNRLLELESAAKKRRKRTVIELEQFEVSLKFILDRVIAAYAAHPSATASIPKNRNLYVQSRYAIQGLSYRTTIDAVLPLLIEDKLIEVVRRGFFDRETGRGKPTQIRATRKLSSQLAQNRFFIPRLLKGQPQTETIRVHNAQKQNVDYVDTEQTIEWRENLRKINNCLLRHWSYLDLTKNEWGLLQQEAMSNAEHFYLPVDVSKQTIYRVFNSTKFNEGGRFYGGWWQNIPSRYRSMVCLDGKETVELDYGQLNPTIMYGKAGLSLDGDAYDIGISSDYRDVVKQVFNTMVQAKKKLTHAPRSIPISMTGLRWKDLVEKVLERHKPIKEMFFVGMGNALQFEDSQIAEKVMLHFVKWDAPILPVHDSFISHHGYESDLNDVMSDAFEQQFGFKAKIKLEPKSFERIRKPGVVDETDLLELIAQENEYGDLFGKG